MVFTELVRLTGIVIAVSVMVISSLLMYKAQNKVVLRKNYIVSMCMAVIGMFILIYLQDVSSFLEQIAFTDIENKTIALIVIGLIIGVLLSNIMKPIKEK